MAHDRSSGNNMTGQLPPRHCWDQSRPPRAYFFLNRPAASCWVFNLSQARLYPTWLCDKWQFASCVFCHWCWRMWRMTSLTTRWGTPASSHLTRRIYHVYWYERCFNSLLSFWYSFPVLCVIHSLLCIDGAIQRTHPGRHAARKEDHSDGHHWLGARQVR